MYDCSKEFIKFYREKVVLRETEQNELREKRRLNIKRLKEPDEALKIASLAQIRK